MNNWKHWHFKYLTILSISIVVSIILLRNESFKHFLLGLGTLEFFGVFIAGLLYVSILTVPIATVIIGLLAQDINPFILSLVGGLGSVIGDILILNLFKDHLLKEVEGLIGDKETSHMKAIGRSKFIAWTLPIVGALIIASPLPDEMGISLLGITNISKFKFMIISFVSNTLGILAIASIANVI